MYVEEYSHIDIVQTCEFLSEKYASSRCVTEGLAPIYTNSRAPTNVIQTYCLQLYIHRSNVLRIPIHIYIYLYRHIQRAMESAVERNVHDKTQKRDPHGIPFGKSRE